MAGRLSLQGLRIVVTRPKDQAGGLMGLLQGMGAEAVSFPVLKVAPPRDQGPLDAALRRLDAFDWVVFGSVNAVRFVFARHAELGLDLGMWSRPSIAAVGDATRAALAERHVKVSVVPEQNDAEGVVDALKQRGVAGCTVLLPQAREGRPVLQEGLRRLGANVTRVEAYESLIDRPSWEAVRALLRDGWDGVTFTSPSTVRNFERIVREAGGDPMLAPAFCIGNVTEEEARSRGFTVKGVATKASPDDLAAVVAAHFETARNGPSP